MKSDKPNNNNANKDRLTKYENKWSSLIPLVETFIQKEKDSFSRMAVICLTILSGTLLCFGYLQAPQYLAWMMFATVVLALLLRKMNNIEKE